MTCPYCSPAPDSVIFDNAHITATWDPTSFTDGQPTVIAKSHITSWFEASSELQYAFTNALKQLHGIVSERQSTSRYHIEIHDGVYPGQLIPHLQARLVPRYDSLPAQPHEDARFAITTGDTDPLYPELRAALAEARHADLAVAFIQNSGLSLIYGHLKDLLERGGRLRIISGDYLDITDPDALTRLLDLKGDIQLRIYETLGKSFHPKAYLTYQPDGALLAFIGSSNLSGSALKDGIEWNARYLSKKDQDSHRLLTSRFEELFFSKQTRALDSAWVDTYRLRRRATTEWKAAEVQPEDPVPGPIPNPIQIEALEALEETRTNGNAAGLVVLATGLGKTWLSAFDATSHPSFKKVLFVAHREEILSQAYETYRQVKPLASMGYYNGQAKDTEVDFLFGSIQTIGRQEHLKKFKKEDFDYIVVDEFHHASARTYRNLIEYFKPKFLLGLTATPERTDGGDLLSLCGQNLVYRCDLIEGINRELLAPFHYLGVPDEIDYENIPWRSGRFDEEALTSALATTARAENAYEQYEKHAGKRTFAFCCSQRHANFMAQFFKSKGIEAVAVHSGEGSAARTDSLERLNEGTLDLICCVDMFNEGVDIRALDTVLMLRPTESIIIFLQQLGRGLRKFEGKVALKVIDYIGNHRSFLLKPQAMLGLPPSHRAISKALKKLERGEYELPKGCEVTYELEARELLAGLLRASNSSDQLEAFYENFKFIHGKRPTAVETYNEHYDPSESGFENWFEFISQMKGLTTSEQAVKAYHNEFLTLLQKAKMTKSYKMLVIKAMMKAGALPGQISIGELATHIRELALKHRHFAEDLGLALNTQKSLEALLLKYPLKAWADSDSHVFKIENGSFSCNQKINTLLADTFLEMVAEIVDWRLAEYHDHHGSIGKSSPKETTEGKAVVWQHYMREYIPALFGFEFSEARWHQGFIHFPGHIFLLVTLEKADLNQEHQYLDHFSDSAIFEWQSQNRTSQNSPHGKIISGHDALGIAVHLFIRRTKKTGTRATPFIYCGDVTFVSWSGEKPIKVRWKLKETLPDSIHKAFKIPET